MESLKILFVGNSFAVDTTHLAVEVAHAMGLKDIKIGTLYVGGCSVDMHYNHAMGDLPVYIYYTNQGDGWTSTPEVSISQAVESDQWDWIIIQHGTSGGSCYTKCECYEKLSPLIDYIKTLAPRARIAFNLAWLGESTRQHHEIISYGGNMILMRQRLEAVTEEMVVNNPKVELLIPTGTAIENARTSKIGLLTRDCFHLSMDKGRYIAALCLISTLTGENADQVTWTPTGVDAYARAVAVEAVNNAIRSPLTVVDTTI